MCEAKSTGYPSIDKPWLKYYSTEAARKQSIQNRLNVLYIKTSTSTTKNT